MTTPAQIRSSSQVRKDFLDFFKSKQHTIVPSSSLMPDSPNLLFTNAGMNQFVPIFLGQTKCPYVPGRAADTQKCIRAGGKHNDLDDVGLDTYHHTFFEMLGNWSFGDYFKREAIDWAWELVVEKWKFPATRLYATVYSPDKSKNDPSEFDQDAWNFWAGKFRSAGLDPTVHIVNGDKKDNFWMMGETGPCGPCSELHVDLTPEGNTQGLLVNKGDARCIEIWNLVFIQFNANPDGTFSPLPARHVDTGMGFERVTSIIQGTKNLTDFASAKTSNYETDIFRPIFDELEKMSGKKYASTLPPADLSTINSQQSTDVAFRVIADHIRTLSFAIADGIQPGNTDRNYVLRRILRRAVRYGRTLGFHEPFFYKLVDVLADTMGDVFPEIRARKKQVQETIRTEEEAFNKTLDTGITIFNLVVDLLEKLRRASIHIEAEFTKLAHKDFNHARSQLPELTDLLFERAKLFEEHGTSLQKSLVHEAFGILSSLEMAPIGVPLIPIPLSNIQAVQNGLPKLIESTRQISGKSAFLLYDTYGFPLDLTELMARERGLTVDKDGFEKLMEEQRTRARAAQKKEIISLSQIKTTSPTKFIGYENLKTNAKLLEVVSLKGRIAVILDTSVCYAEMGGQVGDTGALHIGETDWDIVNTQKSSNTWLHILETLDEKVSRIKELAELLHLGRGRPALSSSDPAEGLIVGAEVKLFVNQFRREAIQRHHTVTHLLHWALHEVASKEASQKGSFVGPDKLTFDFNSPPLTPQQVSDIEKLVNEKILENAGVSWTEVPHADVKNRKDVMQFFGDKYGDTVRVVQIGGGAGKLDGYSMELCGGTHTRATGEIGLFRITGESAIAAGVRRIEAVAGLEAYKRANDELHLIKSLAGKVNSPVHELEKKIESLLAHQKELEKQLKARDQREAADKAQALYEEWKLQAPSVSLQPIQNQLGGIPMILHKFKDASSEYLQVLADAVKQTGFKGVVVFASATGDNVSLLATVSPEFTAKIQAGKIIQQIAPVVGGKGGGRPDNARGGGRNAGKLDEALAKAKSLLG